MSVYASELNEAHVGSEVSYGPGMMFSGEVEEVHLLLGPWFKNSAGELVEWAAPPRVYVKTTDGRCASLAQEQEVRVRLAVTQQEEGEI